MCVSVYVRMLVSSLLLCLLEPIKPRSEAMCRCSPGPACLSPHTLAPTISMYQQHHHWANSSYYCVDDGEVKGGDDAMLSSRPDAMLANGGAFLPTPPLLPSYMPPPPMAMASQLQASIPLSWTSSSGMAAATTSSSSFRRALSTGDLIIRDREEEQRVVAAPARYSAEERRERIDKYRSKRNQRNFQKKITYACRKTLADSRPRVKGRFARNGGDYTDADADADADHHVHVPAAPTHQSESQLPATAAVPPEWWPAAAVQDELPAGINLVELCDDDDEMLAAYLGVSSISIADHHYTCQP